MQLTEDFSKVEVTAKITKRAAGPDGRRREVLDRQSHGHAERDLRPEHAPVRQLHRLRGRQVRERPAPLHRTRRRAVHRRTDRAAVRPEGRPISARSVRGRPSITGGCRSARSSPTISPPDGKIGRDQGLRQCAVRQVSCASARASGTRAVSTSPPTRTASTIRTESLVAVLVGGLAFDDPAVHARPASRAPENAMFTLYREQDDRHEDARRRSRSVTC